MMEKNNNATRHWIARLVLGGMCSLSLISTATAGTYTLLLPHGFERQARVPVAGIINFPAVDTISPYTLNIYNGGLQDHGLTGRLVSSSIISLNGTRILGPRDFGQDVTFLSAQVDLQANNILVVSIKDQSEGGVITLEILGAEDTPPSIEATVTPLANGNAWHNTDVSVSFTCADNISGIQTCAAPVMVQTEGANQVVEGVAVDHAGNTASTSVILNIDTTAPNIQIIAPATNAVLPSLRPVIQLNVSDNLALDQDSLVLIINERLQPELNIAFDGVCSWVNSLATCTPNSDFPTGEITLSASIADQAGNSSDDEVTFFIDFPEDSPSISQIDIVGTDSAGNQFSQGVTRSSLSNDGRFLAFQRSVHTTIGGLVLSYDEIYLKDLLTNVSTRITPVGKYCTNPVISGNGQYVLFKSSSDNIIPGLADGIAHIYVYNKVDQNINLIDINISGIPSNASASANYAISDDGVFIAYNSSGSNIVPGDTNGIGDVFLYDRSDLLLVERVSVSNNGDQLVKPGYSGDISVFAGVSDDARYVLFHSIADNLSVDGSRRVFVRDRTSNTTTQILIDDDGDFLVDIFDASISANGRFITYSSSSPNLPGANGITQVYIHDRSSVLNQLVSSDGENSGNQHNSGPLMSASGRYVVYASSSSNLIANDVNGLRDVFVTDTLTNTTQRVSENLSGVGGNSPSDFQHMQDSAQRIVFGSYATNLVSGDNNGDHDIFMTDNPVLFSNFEFQMTPTTLPTVLPTAGGTVTHNVLVKNNSSSSRNITLFRRILAPDGTIYSLGDDNYSIPSGHFVSETGQSFGIPSSFPFGRYQVVYYIYEDEIFVDSGDYFFFKT